MAPPKSLSAKATTNEKAERVILLISGESGAGKSFFVANLKNALIFDTDIGGGLSYADARIKRNGSERIEVGSYLEVLDELRSRRSQMASITTLAVDHLTVLHQESMARHNPEMKRDFGTASEKAAREWRKLREYVRHGDFNLVCTSHLKSKWENEEVIGSQADAAKKIEGDFQIVLQLFNRGGQFPNTAKVQKWRRDPDDSRGRIPASFPFTNEQFVAIHGFPFEGTRAEAPMATPEQVAEISKLLAVVMLPEGTTGKWLAKAKAETWDDMTADALGKCIDHLKDVAAKAISKPQ